MADFGKILEDWDRYSRRGFRRPLGPDPSRKEEGGEAERRSKSEIVALPVDAVLDLHGLSSQDAWDALSQFFRDAASRGLVKVLVIHGKGHHSEGEPVLKKTVLRFLETSPLAGRHGTADRRQGGSGAVWVMVRSGYQRSR